MFLIPITLFKHGMHIVGLASCNCNDSPKMSILALFKEEKVGNGESGFTKIAPNCGV